MPSSYTFKEPEEPADDLQSRKIRSINFLLAADFELKSADDLFLQLLQFTIFNVNSTSINGLNRDYATLFKSLRPLLALVSDREHKIYAMLFKAVFKIKDNLNILKILLECGFPANVLQEMLQLMAAPDLVDITQSSLFRETVKQIDPIELQRLFEEPTNTAQQNFEPFVPTSLEDGTLDFVPFPTPPPTPPPYLPSPSPALIFKTESTTVLTYERILMLAALIMYCYRIDQCNKTGTCAQIVENDPLLTILTNLNFFVDKEFLLILSNFQIYKAQHADYSWRSILAIVAQLGRGPLFYLGVQQQLAAGFRGSLSAKDSNVIMPLVLSIYVFMCGLSHLYSQSTKALLFRSTINHSPYNSDEEEGLKDYFGYTDPKEPNNSLSPNMRRRASYSNTEELLQPPSVNTPRRSSGLGIV